MCYYCYYYDYLIFSYLIFYYYYSCSEDCENYFVGGCMSCDGDDNHYYLGAMQHGSQMYEVQECSRDANALQFFLYEMKKEKKKKSKGTEQRKHMYFFYVNFLLNVYDFLENKNRYSLSVT